MRLELGWRGVQTAVEAVKAELDTQSGRRFVDTGAQEALLARTDALRLRIDRLEARTALVAQRRAENAGRPTEP